MTIPGSLIISSTAAEASVEREAISRRLSLRLLPQLTLAVDGKQVSVSNRAERMLALLAVRNGSCRRATVAESLWPDAAVDRALASLRTTLWTLHKIDSNIVRVSPSRLSLSPGAAVDLHDASGVARRLIDDTIWITDVPRTLQLLSQDLLPDWFDEWIVFEQEHFRQMRLHALEALGVQLLRRDLHAHAVLAGLEAVACEPLRESAHRLLMCAHISEGNQYEAIKRYHIYATLLRDELGLRPPPRWIRCSSVP
ncbi:bacterial transcriptional activator domain protein [Rhodococcus sp. MTM3W5.2]|uniref:AfsR/SARP family transcriptional regulator n=1 Tax=Rhodococcus sp. MTM3W5.2 TaxID=1805827 RepID=UPI0009797BCF|nr:BTAD domain-containing putative transcriptional regulator [Rhodococcus sp. MTM3W5.2]AQA22767.1 bacterial transcriptional activator domain protein [Rhodococcus sp. MTM3W5.2]